MGRSSGDIALRPPLGICLGNASSHRCYQLASTKEIKEVADFIAAFENYRFEQYFSYFERAQKTTVG
jgi:hypothetical protein